MKDVEFKTKGSCREVAVNPPKLNTNNSSGILDEEREQVTKKKDKKSNNLTKLWHRKQKVKSR